MRLYLDVSCLNRPFDDQRQGRIRLEAEAVAVVFQRIDSGQWTQISSGMAEIEIAAMKDEERRRRVRALLPPRDDIMELTEEVFDRAADLERMGFKPADAVHIAAAEAGEANAFLSCDDRMCRLARRRRLSLHTIVANPVDWLREQGHASDTGTDSH